MELENPEFWEELKELSPFWKQVFEDLKNNPIEPKAKE